MKAVYVSTTVFHDGIPVVEAVRRLVEAGITHIELGSIHRHEEGVLPLLRAQPVQFLIHNYFPPAAGEMVLNLAATSAEVREASLAQIQRSIDACRELGAPLYTFHPGFRGAAAKKNTAQAKTARDYDFSFSGDEHAAPELLFDLFLDSVHRIAMYARSLGFRVACENAGSLAERDRLLMCTAAEFQMLFERAPYPNLGILVDLAHLRLAARAHGFEPREFLAEFSGRIAALHVSENDGMRDLHQALTPGCWSLEILRHCPHDQAYVVFEGRNLQLDQVRRSVELLTEVIN